MDYWLKNFNLSVQNYWKIKILMHNFTTAISVSFNGQKLFVGILQTAAFRWKRISMHLSSMVFDLLTVLLGKNIYNLVFGQASCITVFFSCPAPSDSLLRTREELLKRTWKSMAEMRKYFFLESDPKHTRFGGPFRVRLWIYEELHNKVKKGKIVPQ